jgi:hypothetical protein
MTKKIVGEDTTDLKFKNFNSANSNSATPENDAIPAAFASTFSGKSYPYKLQNCWTLDCGTDIHVCNDRRRFNLIRVVGPDDMIMAGKTTYAIEGYDTVNILAQGPSEQAMSIKLLNVALAPGFLTNLVCLSKFTQKGVH